MNRQREQISNFWDTTGDWRMNYYTILHNTPDEELTEIARAEKKLDELEKQSIIELLSSNVKSILDLGCGVGRSVIELASKYPDKLFVGIDISPYQIHLFNEQIQLLQLTNIKAFEYDVKDIPITNQKFDLIIACNNSFGNFIEETREKCFNELHRLLTDEGSIMISSFDDLSIAQECYNEWKINVISIDKATCLVRLDHYDSFWKNSDMLIKEFAIHNFRCTRIQKAGLGCVQTYKKIK
jgi:cyclopropane fatty-acyl-phospholipid synthase-like methyltransferase